MDARADIFQKIKLHSSCEIEDFNETHLCQQCVILRSRYYWTCVLFKDIGRRFSLKLASARVNRVVKITLCTETIKPVFERDII